MIDIDLFSGNALAKVLFYYGFPLGEEKIVCPFHDDVNPSMKIDLETGTCYCFGCNERFNAFTFVKKAEKINDDLHACLRLAKILKSNKVKRLKLRKVKHKIRHDNKQSLMEASDYYYCLKEIDWYNEHTEEVRYLLARGFKRSTLNMCKVKYTYNYSYPFVFPMLDNGDFKGWVCRTTRKNVEKKRKYLYNEGFSRATTLCGTYSKGKTLIICEGYMDMLKYKQFGIKNVVAILGWKITAEQISKLKDYNITHIISGLDNDVCGKKGTEYLKKFFNVTPFVYPKDVKDAGDMTQTQFDIAFKKTKRLFNNTTKK